MKTNPEDVSSAVLPSSPRAGASVTYCLQKRNIEESAGRNHHLVNEKEKNQGEQTQVRGPGCTPCMTSSHTGDPAGRGLKPGATSHRLYCRAVRLARKSPSDPTRPSRNCFQTSGNVQRQDSSQGEGPPPKLECGTLRLPEWEVGTEMDLATQCSVLPAECHGLFPRLMATNG